MTGKGCAAGGCSGYPGGLTALGNTGLGGLKTVPSMSATPAAGSSAGVDVAGPEGAGTLRSRLACQREPSLSMNVAGPS